MDLGFDSYLRRQQQRGRVNSYLMTEFRTIGLRDQLIWPLSHCSKLNFKSISNFHEQCSFCPESGN